MSSLYVITNLGNADLSFDTFTLRVGGSAYRQTITEDIENAVNKGFVKMDNVGSSSSLFTVLNTSKKRIELNGTPLDPGCTLTLANLTADVQNALSLGYLTLTDNVGPPKPGPTGPTGSQGPTGPKGEDGAVGPTGPAAESSGGSSLQNLVESLVPAVGNALMGPVETLTVTGEQPNISLVLSPKGTGGFATSPSGFTRGIYSVDLQLSTNAGYAIAQGAYSTVSGGQQNTASGEQSFIGGGYLNTASGHRSIVTGGFSNAAVGNHSFIGGGAGNETSGLYSSILGGYNSALYGQYSVVTGGAGATDTGSNFTQLFGAKPGSYGWQSATQLAVSTTTDATPTLLAAGVDVGRGSGFNISTNTAAKFSIDVVGRDTTSGDSAMFEIKVGVKVDNAGAIVFVGTPVVSPQFVDSSAMTWAVLPPVVTFNTSLGLASLLISVTGEEDKTINWIARIDAVMLR